MNKQKLDNPILSEKIIQNATMQYRDKQYFFSKHMHPTMELYYITKGTCCMDMGNQVITCKEGDFVLVMPNIVHSFYLTSDDPCIFKHIHMFSEMLPEISMEPITGHSMDLLSALTFCCDLCYKHSNDDKIETLMSVIIDEYERSHLLSNMYCNLHLIELLFYLIEISEKDLNTYVDSQTIQNYYVNSALRYIQRNYHTKFLIQDIADTLNISGRYLAELFYNQMNMTILNYTNVYRMNQAVLLMQETDLSLTEISQQIGMNDSQHFSKLFRSTIGSPPFQYRKELRKQLEKERSGANIPK